ncbi:MAG TPA: DUF1688 family protein [Polyangiaceae bacterium]|nr:DUF1688 family protein [Polyangiaceae bacterium]
MTAPNEAELSELSYLSSARAVRECALAAYALGSRAELLHFTLDETRLPALVERVLDVTRRRHADLAAIPYHARWRHFAAGGVDRMAALEPALAGLRREERLRSLFELVIVSVLLDAGAGPAWSYREPSGALLTRSEGLAIASLRWFADGGLSTDPQGAPLRADAERLTRVAPAALAEAFQVSADNPLVGLEGRVEILQRLGRVVSEGPRFFGSQAPRLGNLALYLDAVAKNRELAATTLLETVLAAFADIWPGRAVLAGKNLGDVWSHPRLGWVPLHKLSQWLTYSLCEPLEAAGIRITGLDELTGLAEYRNGGLFVDGGVLVPSEPRIWEEAFPVASSVVVEWRTLTVALLDRTAALLRQRAGLSAEELPLAKVLEGGTWFAGRELAFERRPDGAPPIRVQSDGTVF